MILEDLNTLKETGIYARLVKSGVIPLKVNYYYEMNTLYNTKLILNASMKNCIMQSITDVAVSFNCSENSVRNAIKFMKQD